MNTNNKTNRVLRPLAAAILAGLVAGNADAVCRTGDLADPAQENNCVTFDAGAVSEAIVTWSDANIADGRYLQVGFRSNAPLSSVPLTFDVTNIAWSQVDPATAVPADWKPFNDVTVSPTAVSPPYSYTNILDRGTTGSHPPRIWVRYTIPAGYFSTGNVLQVNLLGNNNGSQNPPLPSDGVLSDNLANEFANLTRINTADINTTPVSLSYFKSRQDGNEVVIQFATATETGNLGFEVLVERDGQNVKLGDLIPSKVTDSAEPQIYEVRLPYHAGDHLYSLRDVSVLGLAADHGPYELNQSAGGLPTVKLVDWKEKAAQKQARERLRFNQARAASRKADSLGFAGAQAAGGAAADLVTLKVGSAGVQRIAHADLKAAGVDLSGTAGTSIQLLDAAGKVVPVRLEGLLNGKWQAGSALSFIGQLREGSLHGQENSYRLRKDGNGAGMALTSATPSNSYAAAPWYLDTVKVAPQKLYGYSAPNGDPWYQQRMLSRADAYTVPVQLDSLVAGAAGIKLAVDVWGGTDQSFEGPDHHLVARLNGGAESDVKFDGIVAQSVAVDASQAQPGANTLSVKVPGDLGGKTDLINLEGYRVTYPRGFVARDNGLSFSASARKFQITGLKSNQVQVYRQAANGATTYLNGVKVTAGANGSYTATFAGQVTSTPPTYFVVAGAPAKPKVEPGVAGADCADGDTDYLAVVHPQFDTPLLDGLLARRSSQGLKVRKVTTDALYAQYSGGLAGPEAIQSCVKAMPKLKHLLLVGSDTSDPNNYLGSGSLSFVPTQYVQTDAIVKFTPSDSSYGFIDGQVKVAVGRLPARDNQELARLLTQIETFEGKTYARTLVQAADGYDTAQGYDFKKDAQAMANALPFGWQVRTVYLDDYRTATGFDVASAKAALKAGIESGAAMTSYVGHSSQGLWSFNKLLSLNDALGLDVKGQPTLLTQWGCWNTYFVAPKFDTMAHAFLLGGGKPGAAAAVLGASGLVEADQEAALGKKLSLSLSEPGITLGEAVLKAKQSLLVEHPAYRRVVQSWSLLGDPGQVVEK